jgi:ATP-dependent RNA helicase RhlE
VSAAGSPRVPPAPVRVARSSAINGAGSCDAGRRDATHSDAAAADFAAAQTRNENMNSFADLHLLPSLERAIARQGYRTPTPIQVRAIPPVLAGRDALCCAQTGTGKTAAFALPILDRLARTPRRPDDPGPRALILTPTRELAQQITESFAGCGRYLPLTVTAVFGGVSPGPQVQALRHGTDILVATPGRLLDLMRQGHVRLGAVKTFVLDEADRMLDMGFLPDIRRVLAALPPARQNLMFSATMPPDIATLADRILCHPEKISVTPAGTTVNEVSQRVLFVNRESKRALLGAILRDPALTRVLVFTRTKHGANRVARDLERQGVSAQAIHGNKSQNARTRALGAFKTGELRVLVATDIAARGLDVDRVTHVINFELPSEPESYVHRVGRTARAGASGTALSFCDADERAHLAGIEKLTRSPLEVVTEHPFAALPPARSLESRAPRRRRARGGPLSPGGSRCPSERGA